MQNTKSSTSNESNSLEHRLDIFFNELMTQKKYFNEITKQNSILIKKVNALEQYVYQLLSERSENANIQKEDTKENDVKRKNFKKQKENPPNENHKSKLQHKLPPLNLSKNKDKKDDLKADNSLTEEELKSNEKSKETISHQKVCVPEQKNTRVRKVSINIKENKKEEKKIPEIDQESESSQDQLSDSETDDNEAQKVRTIRTKKERAKRSPETWKKYIEEKVKSPPFKIGYLGEAYVYESLLRMNCFEKITWNANTEDQNNPYVVLNNGNKYFIDENGEHFDIVAEDSDHKKYYFEIKATEKTSRSKHIKQKQKDFYASLDPKNNVCIVTIVKSVLDSPTITYCLFDSLRDKCDKGITEKEAENNFMSYISENKDF